jgi:pyruvate carboxylase
MVACAVAGADAVDTATDSLSGMTSQPSVGAVLASLEGTDQDPGLNVHHVRAIDTYWAQLRLLYSPFEAGLTGRCSPSSRFLLQIVFGRWIMRLGMHET